jgi:serine/threonine protein kinase
MSVPLLGGPSPEKSSKEGPSRKDLKSTDTKAANTGSKVLSTPPSKKRTETQKFLPAKADASNESRQKLAHIALAAYRQKHTQKAQATNEHAEALEKKLTSITDQETAKKTIQVFQATQQIVHKNPRVKDTPLPQTHDIKGVKILTDTTTGEVSAHIAGKEVTAGGYKKIKDVALILRDQVKGFIRFTPKEKTAESISLFAKDIEKEVTRRKELGPIPGLLDILVVSYQPRKKTDDEKTPPVKTRYLMEKCDGDLSEILYDKQNPSSSIQRTPQLIQKSLAFCQGAITALVFMHEKNMAHLDFKLKNILRLGDQGLLTDLGLSEPITEGPPADYSGVKGTGGYIAPEQFASFERKEPFKPTTQMDQWSLGASLLEIIDEDLAKSLIESGKVTFNAADAKNQNPSDETLAPALANLNKQLEFTIDKITQRGPLGNFVGRLLSSNPQNRPSAQECRTFLYETLPQTPPEQWYPRQEMKIQRPIARARPPTKRPIAKT